MPNQMERFTQRARRVLSLAQETAERLQHEHIGPEHLLIGLIHDEGSVAGRVLRDLGLDVRRVEELIERMTRAGTRAPNVRLDLSPGTKKMLELAVDEARRMGHNYIGTEHLLLGLVRQSEGTAIDVLKRLNISPEEVRRQTRRVLQELPPGVPRPVPNAGPLVLEILGGTERGNVPAKIHQFTPNARQVMASAHEKAEQFRHNQIGTGHLLLGFFLATNSTARRILLDLGLDGSQVEHHLKQILGPQERAPGDPLTLSPAVKKTLELAVEEAHLLGEDHIGTEHLLLGLLRQEDDSAQEILARLGITPEAIRTLAREVLARSALLGGFGAGRWFDELDIAKRLARNLRHQPVGTEHLLIALFSELRNRHSQIVHGVDSALDKMLELISSLPSNPPAPGQEPALSDELLRALGLAAEAASRSKSPNLTTEHLLLGLLRQPESRAIDILKQLGISPPDVERLVRARLKSDQDRSQGSVGYDRLFEEQ